MVSQLRKRRPAKTEPPAEASRDRLLAAAREEFSARGFDGAKVDRIARQARVNKAMLYYHFKSKRELYLTILREQFSAVASAVAVVREEPGAPDELLRRYIQTIATVAFARPHFPPMWLREIAEGGRHLDASVIGELRRVLEVLAGILNDGRASGVFRPAHPFVTQMGVMAPLMFFAASAPIRERLSKTLPSALVLPELSAVVAYVQTATLAALTVDSANETPRRPRR
jgi:TetR/AcrR family transcriptional regulator